MARNLRDHLEALMHAFDEAWASIPPTIDSSSVRRFGSGNQQSILEREIAELEQA